VTIWICRWRMNTLVTPLCQPRLSSIAKFSPRRISQSDWNIQIKLNYLHISMRRYVISYWHHYIQKQGYWHPYMKFVIRKMTVLKSKGTVPKKDAKHYCDLYLLNCSWICHLVMALRVRRLWCLTPFSIIFQWYRGGQFYWWRKLEYTKKKGFIFVFIK
jgi:hypothetical protein